MRRLTFLLIGAALAIGIMQAKPWHDGDRGRGRFSGRQRGPAIVYLPGGPANLPPGLAKRHGRLPPGLEKQLLERGQLPPGLEKRGWFFRPWF